MDALKLFAVLAHTTLYSFLRQNVKLPQTMCSTAYISLTT